MKARFLFFVCLLLACSLPLFAQPVLTMVDGTTLTVNANAQNVTSGGLVVNKTLTNGQSFNTGIPANGNTMVKISFMSGSTYYGNTPANITNVVTAKLIYDSTNQVYGIQMTPATGAGKHQHDVAQANIFFAAKPPTKQFCLNVEVMKGSPKTILLANGLLLAATGDLALLPKEGKGACLCGTGQPPAAGSDMEQFHIEKRCDTAKKK